MCVLVFFSSWRSLGPGPRSLRRPNRFLVVENEIQRRPHRVFFPTPSFTCENLCRRFVPRHPVSPVKICVGGVFFPTPSFTCENMRRPPTPSFTCENVSDNRSGQLVGVVRLRRRRRTPAYGDSPPSGMHHRQRQCTHTDTNKHAEHTEHTQNTQKVTAVAAIPLSPCATSCVWHCAT
jgi:hypothetical protein